MHPDLAGRDLRDSAGQLVDGDVVGARDAGGGVLVGAADVEDHDVAVVADLLEVGERGGGEARQLTVGPVLRSTGGVGGRTVDADPDQLALGFGDVVRRLPEQGHRGAPGDQPPEVGGEGPVDPEVEGARRVAGREGGPVAQVDHPLPGLDAATQLGGIGGGGRGQVGLGGALGVRGHHVRVVRGPGAQARQQLPDVGLLVLGQDRVGLLLLADGRLGRLRLRGRTERPEAVGGEDVCVVGEQVGQPVRRGVLLAGQSSACSSPSRSGRPVAPNSSDPPENTPTEASTPASPSRRRRGQRR